MESRGLIEFMILEGETPINIHRRLMVGEFTIDVSNVRKKAKCRKCHQEKKCPVSCYSMTYSATHKSMYLGGNHMAGPQPTIPHTVQIWHPQTFNGLVLSRNAL